MILYSLKLSKKDRNGKMFSLISMLRDRLLVPLLASLSSFHVDLEDDSRIIFNSI